MDDEYYQWSLQVEGLSVLAKQHDVFLQVVQTAVLVAPDALLYRTENRIQHLNLYLLIYYYELPIEI